MFQAAGDLRDSTEVSAADYQRLRNLFDWFNQNLEKPTRLAASLRPHAQNQAISWFKDSAKEHIARMWEFAEVLSIYGIQVEIIRTRRPGYVVYEDEYQVAAVAFSDTPT